MQLRLCERWGLAADPGYHLLLSRSGLLMSQELLTLNKNRVQLVFHVTHVKKCALKIAVRKSHRKGLSFIIILLIIVVVVLLLFLGQKWSTR